MASGKRRYLALIVVLGLGCANSAADQRQDPQQVPVNAKLQSTKQQNRPHNSTTCRNSDELAYNVEICAQPLMDILQGTIEKWPANVADAGELCDKVGSRLIRSLLPSGHQSLANVLFSLPQPNDVSETMDANAQ